MEKMILVTGGTGLVGSHLLYLLTSQGIKVKALIRDENKKKRVLKTFSYYTDNPEKLFSQIEWVPGDLTDMCSLEDALNEVNKVYHVAAYVSFNPGNKQKIFDVNVKGTANIVNLCLEKQISKFVFVSSIAALGQTENNLPVTEDILWKPSKKYSSYSLSKYYAEMEVWRGITEGLNAAIINPAVILGPGDWSQGSPLIFASAYKGIPFYTEGINGYVDVRDVAKAMFILMESNISAERFTLCSENLSYREILTIISSSVKKNPPRIKANPFLLTAFQKYEYLRSRLFNTEPRLTSDTVSIIQKISLYSNKKSKDLLTIEYIPIKDTIHFIGNIFLKEKRNKLA